MRTKYKKLLLIVVLAMVYFLISINTEGFYMIRTKGRCNNTMAEMKELRELILDTHYTLNLFKVTHFLAYGSLWGALRYNDIIPWDYDFDFGIVQEDIQSLDADKMIDAFIKKDIKLEYSAYGGFYKVRRHNVSGDLMVFSEYYQDGIMRRTGFESWIFFIQYRWYHQFPSYLIKKPLPLHQFIGKDLPVPRDGIEIQKHFYPNNWWKETIPEGCNRKSLVAQTVQ
ncbi:ribitol 5-phosphate transferase FKRP isoform X3 [Hydra vulgaris]|uniref:Ribitol 5-phosphate transferase FKRP isoform X3 n=1 Tax=Hydra vulgaris TaxID=6087 RepID=A0ABM4CCE2_HYDVU